MNVQRYVISAPGYQDVKILRPVQVGEDPWGCLAPLRGTHWEPLIAVIDGETYSFALHGHLLPLLGKLGSPPLVQARKVPVALRWCALHPRDCPMADIFCHPGEKTPDCYEARGLKTEAAMMAARLVVQAWAEQRYVVVVVGEEFSF